MTAALSKGFLPIRPILTEATRPLFRSFRLDSKPPGLWRKARMSVDAMACLHPGVYQDTLAVRLVTPQREHGQYPNGLEVY